MMKKVILLSIFLLSIPIAYADKIPFDYSVSYEAPNGYGTYYGFSGAVFSSPVIYSNQPLTYTISVTAHKDFKDLKIIAIQEYYCETEEISTFVFNCTHENFSPMTGNSIFIYNVSQISNGHTVTFTKTYDGSTETFSSLDRTHLIIMHCPSNVCENHWNEFFDTYLHHYYNFNHLNKTALSNEDWKFFKFGKIIVDDPFAGMWCPF